MGRNRKQSLLERIHDPQRILRAKCGLDCTVILTRVRDFFMGEVDLEKSGSSVVVPGKNRATLSM